MQMNSLAIVVSLVGVMSSLFTCFMNVYLLKKVFKSKQKKKEMTLFYYRFFLDVLLGLNVAVYLTIVILYSSNMEQLSSLQIFIFYSGFPSSNIGACRSIITLAITLERNLAAYTPIFFHNFQQRFPTVSIFVFAALFGLFEHFVLFKICDFSLIIPQNCAALGCFINTCFLTYWTTHKSTIFALMFLFSMTLCVKLLILNKFGDTANVQLSRVNRLALIDAANVCIFDFLPSFIANRWSATQFFSFQKIGPYGAAAKLLGCAIEAALVFKTIISRSEFNVSENSKTHNPNQKTARVGATVM